MNRTKRAILRWSFIGAFLLVAPIVILATAGYRFNLAKGGLERTGVIIVDSDPRGAAVYLNDRRLAPTTPTKAVRVFPGSYQLRLEKAGYRPWERDITIESGQTTFVNDATLFSESLPEFERALATDQVTFSPDGRFLAAIVESYGVLEMRIVDLRTGLEQTPWRAPADLRVFRFSWSTDGQRLLVERDGGVIPSFVVWDASAPDAAHDLTNRPFRQAFWSDNLLYAADSAELYEIDPLTYSRQDVGPAAESLSVVGDTVYGLRPDPGGPVIVKRALRDSGYRDIAVLPSGAYHPISGGGHVGFVNDDQIYLLGLSKSVTEIPGADGVWSADGSKFAHWDGLELHIYDVRSGTDNLLTRIGSDISDVAWFKHDAMVVYAGGGALTATASGQPESKSEATLATMDVIYGFYFDANSDHAWIVGKLGHDEGLFNLKLK
jgi:hypothetical protein